MNKTGLVYSSRLRSALLCVTSLWILAILAILAAEIVTCYLNGTGFDNGIKRTITVDISLFFPYFIVAAFILRILALRLNLFHSLRKHVTTPEHQPPAVLSPIEAGLLVDNRFTFNEIAATIKNLELRGCISITQDGINLNIQWLDTTGVNDDELQFLSTLFKQGDVFSTADPASKATFLAASHTLVQRVRSRLVGEGRLSTNSRFYQLTGIFINVLVVAAIIAQLHFTIDAFLPTSQTFNIGYPRYAMNASEPIMEVCVVVLISIIGLSGFRRTALTDSRGLKNWHYVAGLKMYLEKTYKDRFYRDGQQMATDSEMRAFYPYAIAFGIERKFENRLRRALSVD